MRLAGHVGESDHDGQERAGHGDRGTVAAKGTGRVVSGSHPARNVELAMISRSAGAPLQVRHP